MQAERLPQGGTIGLFCLSHVADMGRYNANIATLEQLGFNVKLGANFQKGTYGYAASAEERAADFNELVADEAVQLVMFSGGSSAVEILPYINYDAVRKNPKLFSSYSDGTSILNAIYAQTGLGLVTYYGTCSGIFGDLRCFDYNYMQFCQHFVEGHTAEHFVKDSEWKALCGGSCEGTLIGGYTSLFGQMLANRYFKYDRDTKYILLLESHEKYCKVGTAASDLAFIGQSEFMQNVVGLVFGHYSENVPDDLFRCLQRFGMNHNIPVVYTDDFGHGTKHAVFPIGANAKLDADERHMSFCY